MFMIQSKKAPHVKQNQETVLILCVYILCIFVWFWTKQVKSTFFCDQKCKFYSEFDLSFHLYIFFHVFYHFLSIPRLISSFFYFLFLQLSFIFKYINKCFITIFTIPIQTVKANKNLHQLLLFKLTKKFKIM